VINLDIAYVYGGNWPSQGAAGSFCTFTGYGLAKSNQQGQVYLYVAKNSDKKQKKILKDYYGLDVLSNYKIELFNNDSLFGRVMKFYIDSFNKLRKLAKEDNLDAVITRKVGFLPYLYILKKLYGIKVFFEAHDFYLDQDLKGSSGKKKKELFENLFLPRLNGIITHQNQLKNLYQNYIPEQNYCVARTGIREVSQIDRLWDNNYLVYIGSL
jgi:hypothetical protein